MQVFVTGAAGRVGGMLKLAWDAYEKPAFQPVWSTRHARGPGYLTWDILSGRAAPIQSGAVILHLAGVLSGTRDDLSANTAMALQVCDAAKQAGARHVFIASSAAVYEASLGDHAEDDHADPVSEYGIAKLQMEQAVLTSPQSPHAFPGVTCLRIGNVIGADALVGKIVAGQPVALDAVAGQVGGPSRSYIGPRALAFVLSRLVNLAAQGERLPSVLNVAASHPVHMADLLAAAQCPYYFQPSDKGVIAKVSLSTDRLAELMPAPKQNAADLIADWKSLVGVAA